MSCLEKWGLLLTIWGRNGLNPEWKGLPICLCSGGHTCLSTAEIFSWVVWSRAVLLKFSCPRESPRNLVNRRLWPRWSAGAWHAVSNQVILILSYWVRGKASALELRTHKFAISAMTLMFKPQFSGFQFLHFYVLWELTITDAISKCQTQS